ncbi:ABC transporter permease, partial [Actinocorallia lasiicapitis]
GGLAGALPARFGGVPGRLAVDNARRTPRRTATTAIALTVGIGLMSTFVVIAASGKATSVAAVEKAVPVDFILYSMGVRPIPQAVAAELRALPEIEKVAEQRVSDAKVGGKRYLMVTMTPADGLGAVAGLATLRPDQVIVPSWVADELKVVQGGRLDTSAGTFTIAEIIPDPMGEVSGPVIANAPFAKAFPKAGVTTIYVNGRQGVDAKAAVRKVLRAHDEVGMNATVDLRSQLEDSYDTMLLTFAGLLGLAVLIALFGIVNTLTLSVIERTRESALLRALGLTKHQLRRMLLTEALVMAVIGALVGVTLGVFYGWVSLRSLSESMVFALPVRQLLGLLLLAALAGALAGVLPARRAARASIVTSLA